MKTVTASERDQAGPPRTLTPEESEQLRAWHQQLKTLRPPLEPGSARVIPDAFQMRLSLEGGPSFQVNTLGFPVGGKGAFDPLLEWLDKTLTEELRRNNPGRATVLTPDEI